MPIRPENRNRYPPNWAEISKRIRFERAKNKCEMCGVENYTTNPRTGSKVVLTVAHLDNTPENCEESNLKALCQKCHLGLDKDLHIRNRKLNKAGAYIKGEGYINHHQLFNDYDPF